MEGGCFADPYIGGFAVADILNVARAVPPKCRTAAPVVIGNRDAMRWGAALGAKTPADECDLNFESLLKIETRAFYIGNYGFSCLYMRDPAGHVQTQGWVVGWDTETVPPVFLHEFAVLHSLTGVLAYLQRGNNNRLPTVILVRAGRMLEQNRLLKWCNNGKIGLESAAAGRII